MNPGTFIADNFLYAFQGFNINNKIVEKIERLSLKTTEEAWETIVVKN